MKLIHTNTKTTEDFKKEVEEKYGNEFDILTPYKGYNQFLTVRHNVCGSTYEIQPHYFMRREDNCRICRKTEKVKKEIYKQRKDEYSLIGHFVNYKTPIKIQHNKCGNIYDVNPGVFLQGANCKQCTNLEKYKTSEQFKDEVFEEVEDEYMVLGEYVSNLTPIKMVHMDCDNTFEITPHDFLSQKYRCPHCRTRKKVSKEEFENKLYEEVGDEYTLIGDFENLNTPVTLFHKNCNQEWKVRPLGFLNKGNRCPICQGVAKKTHEQFEKEVREVTNNTFTVIGEYINNKTPITIKHNICEQTFEKRPHNFLQHPRCPHCEGFITSGKKRTTKDFKKIVKELVGEEYSVLSPYTHSQDLIKMRHNKCENEYEVTPTSFIHHNTRCPSCAREKLKKNLMRTHEDFINEIVKPIKGYEVLDEYQGAHTKIRFKHTVCGKVFEKTPNEFKYGKHCPNCVVQLNERAENFKQRILEKFGEPYEIVGEYKNARTKVKIKHSKCGEVFEKTPDNMLVSIGCPKCNKPTTKLMTTEEFQEKVSKHRESQYTVLSEYKGSNKPVTLRHEECGNVFDITPTGFFQKRGCTKCPPHKR